MDEYVRGMRVRVRWLRGEIREQSERAIRWWSEQNGAEWSECGIVTRLSLRLDRLLVLNHPLLLSIIKIIESGLQVLLSQAANAVRSHGQKSDCLSYSLASAGYLSLTSSLPFLHL